MGRSDTMEVEMTPEEERERTRILLEKMGRHVSMIAFVLPEPATPHDVINNGTVSFLSLPKGKFLVTNHHVWHTYCDDRRSTPGLRLAVMGEGFRRPVDVSSAELVDSDAGIDLAVLRFQHPDLIEQIGKSFYEPKRWPLDVGQAGDDVAFVGFPGKRSHPTDEALRFESVLLSPKVLSVSDRKLLLQFENPNPLIHVFSSRPIDEFTWGGMSGSMVYRLDPSLNQFFVTGFLHAAGEGLQGSFFASRADLLLDDGTIKC
jgi:hypothetical protein